MHQAAATTLECRCWGWRVLPSVVVLCPVDFCLEPNTYSYGGAAVGRGPRCHGCAALTSEGMLGTSPKENSKLSHWLFPAGMGS